MSPDDVRQEIELKVVELLKRLAEEGTITEERSQTVAQIILDTLKPGMTWEALLKAIPKLDDTATELAPIILPYLREYETMVSQKAIKEVTNLIRMGQYDAATKLSKQVINQEGITIVGTGNAS